MAKLVSHLLAFAAGVVVALVLAGGPSGPAAANSKMHRAYYPSGALWRECPLDWRGGLHGDMREYDEQGELTGIMEMSHGQFVRGRVY